MQCSALAISTLTLLLAAPGSALATLTFDNFEEGAFSLTANSGSGFVFDSQDGLSTANVLAGARSVQLQSGGGGVPGTSATVELVLTAGDDAAGLQFDGFTQGQLFLTFGYAFSSSIDLTQGASLDRFLVDVVLASVSPSVNLQLSATDSLGADGFFLVPILAAGQVSFPFSSFTGEGTLDFTQIVQVTLLLRGSPPQSAGSVQISNIAVVPAPSTALLLAAGLAALGARRRRF